MSVYYDCCGNKCNRLSIGDVTLIGKSICFDDTESVEYSYSTGNMVYRGMLARQYKSGLTKEEALKIANETYQKNAPFGNGEIPFELVANLRGDLKWCVFTGNLETNERRIENRTAPKVRYSVRNMTKGLFVQQEREEDKVKLVPADDRTVFYDESDAESLQQMLDDSESDCYCVITENTQNYTVEFEIKAKVVIDISAGSPDEAYPKAKEKFKKLKFGAAEDVEGEISSIRDEEGEFVYEKE